MKAQCSVWWMQTHLFWSLFVLTAQFQLFGLRGISSWVWICYSSVTCWTVRFGRLGVLLAGRKSCWWCRMRHRVAEMEDCLPMGQQPPVCSEGAESPSPVLEPLMECSTQGSSSRDGHTAAVCWQLRGLDESSTKQYSESFQIIWNVAGQLNAFNSHLFYRRAVTIFGSLLSLTSNTRETLQKKHSSP